MTKKEQEEKQKLKAANAVNTETQKEIKTPEKTTIEAQVPIINTSKKKWSYKEKLEFETLEKSIAQLESEKAKLTEQLNAGSSNHEDILGWSKRIADITTDLDEKGLRWLELSEEV